jgi:hypothetical protein
MGRSEWAARLQTGDGDTNLEYPFDSELWIPRSELELWDSRSEIMITAASVLAGRDTVPHAAVRLSSKTFQLAGIESYESLRAKNES